MTPSSATRTSGVDGGREQAAALLDRPEPPTAIFAFNDGMAIGVLQEAAARGLKVPGDCSVVGFDDTVEASVTVPALTTVPASRSPSWAAPRSASCSASWGTGGSSRCGSSWRPGWCQGLDAGHFPAKPVH